MLWDASATHGYSIDASDGSLGTVNDFLFSDGSWRIRWLVVDTGNWLSGRKVLLHPSVLGQPDAARRRFPVALTKAQVKGSPDVSTDQPVSRQMESHLYDYYGYDPAWGDAYFGMGAMPTPLSSPPYLSGSRSHDRVDADIPSNDGDSHLRSVGAVTGYHIHATDGSIGHVEDLLVDDVRWDIRYIVVDTRNWRPGEKVLISPRSVREIEWTGKLMTLDVAREQVKGSPRYEIRPRQSTMLMTNSSTRIMAGQITGFSADGHSDRHVP
jgi:hypothetical protein